MQERISSILKGTSFVAEQITLAAGTKELAVWSEAAYQASGSGERADVDTGTARHECRFEIGDRGYVCAGKNLAEKLFGLGSLDRREQSGERPANCFRNRAAVGCGSDAFV